MIAEQNRVFPCFGFLEGMLGAGIVFLIMGLFLLAGVVYTLIKIYKPNDENVKTDKNHSQEGIIK